MKNAEKVVSAINEYVKKHGVGTEITRSEFHEIVLDKYPEVNPTSILPTDFCYNMTNNGLRDQNDGERCLECIDKGVFRALGTDYKYSGEVYHYMFKPNQVVVGRWVEGEFYPGSEDKLPSYDNIRVNNLVNGLKDAFKGTPMEVGAEADNVFVKFMQQLITSVDVLDECYRINNVTLDWTKQTSYHCEEVGDGTWYYFVDTMDECLGECQRLVIFEARKGSSQAVSSKGQSELRRIMTRDLFEKGYRIFIEQADKNVISKKSHGEKLPYGISKEDDDSIKEIDGKGIFGVGQHFGQGAASSSPYINWFVVSIYYIPATGRIVMGIEKDRYDGLKNMKPLRYTQVGNKKVDVAVFYESTKEKLNYDDLYNKFIDVCEEVMRIGW